MTGGETLARIVEQLAIIVHSTLNGWVNVTNTAEPGGSQLAFTLLPGGASVAQWASDMMLQYAIIINWLAHFPLLGANLARLLVLIMGLGSV